MTKSFATTVVLDDHDERVLLILRADFRVWALPGGAIEDGETPAQAAVRETFEETGYLVSLDRHAGTYHRPQLQDTRYVYCAHVVGGQAIDTGPETLAVSWFAWNELPAKITPFTSQIIQDALAYTGGPFEKEQRLALWQVLYMRTRLAWRDLRNRWAGRR